MELACVVEKMNPGMTDRLPAVAVIGGLSVCNHHLDMITEALRRQQTMSEIMVYILAGEFN